MRFLVTRPQPDCKRTADKLRAAGHVADEAPLLLFQSISPERFDPASVSALAFSSRRAVEAFAAHNRSAQFEHVPVFTVGDKTAAACRDAGFLEVQSADGDVDALGHLILENRETVERGIVLYPVAQDRAGDLEGLLANGNISCKPVIVYRMEQATALPSGVVEALQTAAYGGVLVYSRRTAETLLMLLKTYGLDHIFSRLAIYCISRQAAEPLSDYMRVHVADAPSEKSLLDLTLAEC